MYTPDLVPNDSLDLQIYLEREFEKLKLELFNANFNKVNLVEQHVLVDRPQDGDLVRYAANVVAPSTAAGYYEYIGSSWVKL